MSAGDDVHFFDGPGIEEGSGAVPKWFIGFMAFLFVVVIAYLGVYLVDAQPGTARITDDTAAEQPAETPPAEDGEAATDGE